MGLTFGAWLDGPQMRSATRRWREGTKVRCASATRIHLLPAFGGRDLADITPGRVRRWYAGVADRTPGAANRALDVLRHALGRAVDAGRLPAPNPAAGIRRARLRDRTRYLDGAEISRLLAALDEPRPHRGSGPQQAEAIRLLLWTGCRRSEILRLRWADVRSPRRPELLALGRTKTGPRMVPLGRPARAVIGRQESRGSSPWVFPSHRDPARPRALELSLWRALKRELPFLADVRLHDLRHTFASQAVLNGVSLPLVQQLLGHANISMTQRYAHIADAEAERAAGRVAARMASLLFPGDRQLDLPMEVR